MKFVYNVVVFLRRTASLKALGDLNSQDSLWHPHWFGRDDRAIRASYNFDSSLRRIIGRKSQPTPSELAQRTIVDRHRRIMLIYIVLVPVALFTAPTKTVETLVKIDRLPAGLFFGRSIFFGCTA